MSENIITDAKSAQSIVRYVRDRGTVVYVEYIEKNGVTADTVSAHVAALAALAFPKYDKDTATDEDKKTRKYFMNTVRNGLNYYVGADSNKSNKSDKYVTAEGLKAETWEAFVTKARAEWVAANETK